ncbi:CHAT domain-containing protein [Cyathus striatus]|nr:CHAT domain-containing protein [Cyathus striatus]
MDTSSALLISVNDVQHVPLLSADNLQLGYRNHSYSNIDMPDICLPAQFLDEKPKELPLSDTSLRDVLHWIWDAVSKPIIQALGVEKSDNPKRIWWCPTGNFSFLPLHAAGIYEEGISLHQPPESISDYLISSYIPTIASTRSSTDVEMMVVLESRTLPWTACALGSTCNLRGEAHNPATIEHVVSRLPTASIVHFSCHGMQNVVNPLESALLLDDGPLTIRDILKQPMLHSQLAFLCACETATGTEDLADEAMSFGTSLLYSGFNSAVATMWSIADEDGATISDYFYEYLFNDRGLENRKGCLSDTNQSAHALHHAIKALRSSGVPLERWVPFIHMGA